MQKRSHTAPRHIHTSVWARGPRLSPLRVAGSCQSLLRLLERGRKEALCRQGTSADGRARRARTHGKRHKEGQHHEQPCQGTGGSWAGPFLMEGLLFTEGCEPAQPPPHVPGMPLSQASGQPEPRLPLAEGGHEAPLSVTPSSGGPGRAKDSPRACSCHTLRAQRADRLEEAVQMQQSFHTDSPPRRQALRQALETQQQNLTLELQG